MPASIDRRGRLVPEAEFYEAQEAERQARVSEFARRAGQLAVAPARGEVQPLDWEPPSSRTHDPHTLEAARARLVESLNSRG